MNRSARVLAGVLLGCSIGAQTSLAAPSDYTFKIVADSSGPLNRFGTPTINRNGTVAFIATTDAGGGGVYTSNGVVQTVFDFGSSSVGNFDSNPVRINDAGTVAYVAADGSYVATGAASGGPQTIIADTSGPFSRFASTDIDASGRVVFSAGRDVGGGGFYASNAGTITTLVTTDDGYTTLGGLKVNDGGTAIGRGRRTTGTDTIFTIANGTLTTVANNASSQFAGFGDAPTINSTGEIALYANGRNPSGLAVFKISDGTRSIVASEGADFAALNEGMIDDAGNVVFFAVPTAGGPPRGIYAGANPSTDRVIGVGDALGGSTITAIQINDGVSPNGDIAFTYYLNNGASGIAIASRIVPEPTSLAFCAGLIALAGRRRR